MHRDDYYDKWNGYLQAFQQYYDGKNSKLITKRMFDLLLADDFQTGKPRIELALIRAKRICEQYPHISPADQESSTTVFKLVEEILKYT